LRSIVIHWTAGDYETVYDAYHFCLSGAAQIRVHATYDLRANMRDVRASATPAYAAHTAGRNSYAIGIAMCAMRAATPGDFGGAPITTAQIEAACVLAARLVAFYDIPLAAVRTHAEAALEDGYFGAAAIDERWDVARFEPSSAPLLASEARACGERFRTRIAELVV